MRAWTGFGVFLAFAALLWTADASAQSYLSLCADTPHEQTAQCQGLKAADARYQKARDAVPITSVMALQIGPEIADGACTGRLPSGYSNAFNQLKDTPACVELREAKADRMRFIAAVQALVGDGEALVAGSVLPVLRVNSEHVALVGKPQRIEGQVGFDASVPRLKINGQPATLFELRPGERGVARHAYGFRIDVPTDREGTHIYTLEACDAAGTCLGKDVVVRVLEADTPVSKGRNYALIIGNDDYKSLPKLKTAVADAKAVAGVLKTRYAFDDKTVKLLINADRSTILRELARLRRTLGADDRLLVYYAGHGQIDQAANEGFWLPVDAVADGDDTWVSNSDLRRNLRAMAARHVLIVADSCFSGTLTRAAPDMRDGIDQAKGTDRYFAGIDSKFSRKVITSGGFEPVADSGSGQHSVFAHYFLRALNENALPYVTSFELFNSLARAVTNNSQQRPEYGIIAQAGDEGAGDFTFILKN